MNRYQLESRIRSVGLAYILLFIAGAHYAYLNRWGTQILFWITLGGFGIWWLIDIFRLARMVHEFNDPIFEEIDWLDHQHHERYDRHDDYDRYERDDFHDLNERQAMRKRNLLDDDW